MIIKKIKNQIKKKIFFAFTFILCAVCFSCSKNSEVVISESNKVTEVSNTTLNETTSTETEASFVIESIDLSDVSGDQYRNTLSKVDELNHRIGKDIYVTKEDYFNYKDTKVSIIGDSISDLSKTYLNRFFKNLTQDSVSGREMELGIEAFDAMKELDRVGDIMILSLGNNAMKGIDAEVLEHVYQGMEGRPLIIPTIVMPYVGQERNRNRDLVNFAKNHDNCYIADWNKLARMSDTFITEDGVHPTGDGSAAYAQLLFKTVVDIVRE